MQNWELYKKEKKNRPLFSDILGRLEKGIQTFFFLGIICYM